MGKSQGHLQALRKGIYLDCNSSCFSSLLFLPSGNPSKITIDLFPLVANNRYLFWLLETLTERAKSIKIFAQSLTFQRFSILSRSCSICLLFLFYLIYSHRHLHLVSFLKWMFFFDEKTHAHVIEQNGAKNRQTTKANE